MRKPAPAPAGSGRGWFRTGATPRALAITSLVAAAPAVAAKDRARWDTRVLVLVGKPGFPAPAFVAPWGRTYEGTYENPTGSSRPSLIREYAGDGTLLRTWTVPGQDPSGGQGVQVATDARRRLACLTAPPPACCC